MSFMSDLGTQMSSTEGEVPMQNGDIPMHRSSSEGASLGNLMSGSLSIEGQEQEQQALGSGQKRPSPRPTVPETEGLAQVASSFMNSLPENGSKRQRQSRYVVIDGHAVLKSNNYTIDDGFISVFDSENAMDTSKLNSAEGERSAGSSTGLDPTGSFTVGGDGEFTISSSGKVVRVADQLAKAQRAKERKERLAKEKRENPEAFENKFRGDPIAHAHRAALKDDSDTAEIRRNLYVSRNLDIFRLFLTPAQMKRATEMKSDVADGSFGTGKGSSKDSTGKEDSDDKNKKKSKIKGADTMDAETLAKHEAKKAKEDEAKRYVNEDV